MVPIERSSSVAMNHIVLLSFNDPTRAAPLFAALERLKETVPGITSYSFGPYSSHEGMNRGYTHGFVFVFENAAARDVYLDHPDHVKVKETFLPAVSQVVAFDYES